MKTKYIFSRSHQQKANERGSALMVALLLAAAIAIALGSYLHLARTTLSLSHRSFYNNVAMNLAETGLERGMRSLNMHKTGVAGAWTSPWTWDLSSGTPFIVFNNSVTYSGNTTGSYCVRIQGHNTTSPTIVTRSRVALHQGSPVEKWIKVELTKSSKHDLGMLGDKIKFSGAGTGADSYNSDDGPYTPAPDTGNRGSEITVAATSIEDDSLNLNNAKIDGNVATGSGDNDGIKFGPGSTVTGDTTHDFTYDFEDIIAPVVATNTGSINGTYELGTTGGVAGTHQKQSVLFYTYTDITVGAGKTLSVAPGTHVVVTLTKASGDALKVSGNGATIVIPANSSLVIYTEANVSIGGTGVANAGVPANFQIWGTRPQSDSQMQDIDISGNGTLSAVIYAPNAKISLNGGGSPGTGNVFGSVVGKEILVHGGSKFHYDVSLRNKDFGDSYRLKDWVELTTAAERTAHSADLAF